MSFKFLHQSIKPLLLFELPITKGDQILISKRRNVHQIFTSGRQSFRFLLNAWCVNRSMRNRGLRTCIKRLRTGIKSQEKMQHAKT